MARKRKVNYWKSRGAYGCWINGRQTILACGPDDAPSGPAFTAALARYREILDLQSVNSAGDRNTVNVVADHYCQWLRTHRSAATLSIRLATLTPFVDRFDSREINSLVRHEITQWLAAQRAAGWGDGQVRNALHSLNACFNWAKKEGLCTLNPVAGVEQPAAGSRGEEAYVSGDDFRRLLAAMRPDPREYAIVLYTTGARPGEIRLAAGRDFRPDIPALVYPATEASAGKHKTRRHKRDRVILLTGDALRIVQTRVDRYGTGTLFPAKGRSRPRIAHSVRELFRRAGFRAGIPGVTPYSLRHSFCTDWILAGKPVEILAELIESSPAVIRRHYQHLHVNTGRLMDHLTDFRGGKNW